MMGFFCSGVVYALLFYYNIKTWIKSELILYSAFSGNSVPCKLFRSKLLKTLKIIVKIIVKRKLFLNLNFKYIYRGKVMQDRWTLYSLYYWLCFSSNVKTRRTSKIYPHYWWYKNVKN